jgi:UDP-N-acetylmuramoyl-tripeptide--D-alanyl-D-alanine ligase
LARWRVADAASVAAGRVAGDAPEAASFEGAAIDSRAVSGGELFVAFAGSRTDGHRFVPDAFARGAAAAMVNEGGEVPESGATGTPGPLIRVPDTFRALHDLARATRERTPERLAGITGSAGKTTTKELLADMLAARFRTARTKGNFNNLYGLPLTLLSVPEGTEWLVAEMGMSSAGELRQLSLLARPDVALFTVVRPAHLEFFGSVRAIAEAKSELLAGLAPDGTIVANADDPEVARIAREKAAGRKVVWYGIAEAHAKADVVAKNVAPAPAGEVGTRFTLEAGGESAPVALPLHGLYNVENCLAAAACAWSLGVPLADIAKAAAGARPAAKRGVVHRLPGGVTLVDDSYNSNPDAVARAIESAALLPAHRRWAVLGDMLELGPEAPRFHREAGERAAAAGFSPVWGVGPLGGELADGARRKGAAADALPSAADAAERAAGEIRDGDLVLVKGSRGIGLEAVVSRLMSERPAERPAAGSDAVADVAASQEGAA